MSNTISGNFPSGYDLTNPGSNPVTVTGTITLGTGTLAAALQGETVAAWTVTNDGSITGGSGLGVDLRAGGTITNAATAWIGGAIGIAIQGTTGVLSNAGTVTGSLSNAGAAGVQFTHGGTVTNVSGGLIQSGGTGVRIQSGYGAPQNNAAVTNLGTINASLAALNGVGVYLIGGGTITNGAGGLLESGGYGIVVEATPGTASSAGVVAVVNNAGIIKSAENGGSAASVFVTVGGTLTNASGGQILSGGYGVVARDDAFTVTNAGIINATANFAAVDLLAGGAVTNASGGTITGKWGVSIQGAANGSVANAGVITGGSESGVFLSGGTLVNQAGGTISGYWAVADVTAPATIINAGTMIGTGGVAVTLPSGVANSLVVDPGAYFVGIADGGNTIGSTIVSTLELASTSSIGTLTGIGTEFVDFGQTEVDSGATWNLTGTNALGGGSLNDSGRLTVNAASLTGAGAITVGDTVNAALNIGQNGTVAANTVALGLNAATQGQAVVSGVGSQLLTASGLTVGAAGVGALTVQLGGSVQVAGPLEVGQISGGSGLISVTGSASALTDTGSIVVGDGGVGSLSIYGGGAVAIASSATIANTTSASGSAIDVTGSTASLSIGSTLAVGAGGSGQLSVAQGASVTVGALSVGAVAGGGGLVSVQGTGSDVIVSGALSVGGAASGDLEIQGGALVSAASGSIGTGAAGIIVVGVGSTLSVPGILNVGGAAVADAGELYLEGGTFVGGTAGAVDYGAHGFLVVSDNGVFDANPTVTVTGNTYNGSSIEAEVEIVNGATTFAKAPNVGQALNVFLAPLITYAGSTAPSALKPDLWTINTDGTLELDANTVDKSQEFSFADNTGVLWIGQQVTINTSNNPQTIQAAAIGGFSGLIDSYSTGDQIIVDTANPAGFNYNTVAPTGTITVNDLSGGALEGVLTFDTTEEAQAVWADYQAFQAGSLAASPLVDMALACFAAGTRIETPEGPVAVEDLAVGGTVVTLPGGSGRIVWTGSRAVDCTRHPRPEAVWPVRVSAGAFGPGMPARDLFLSPDHAVYVEDVLIPVKHLVNGDSIHQVPMEHVVYHHIELERHDVVLAEGLAAESYLDTGDRADFGSESTVIRLHPMFERTADAAMLWETRGAAPLVQSGAVLERVRAAIMARRPAAIPIASVR